jgi:hydroxymethylglutaryl-CoA lyase
LALTNIYSAMKFGVQRFDSSIGGMGGCPYAPGASGNLSTEDLANLLFHSKKIKGINLSKLCEAGALAQELLAKKLPSKFLQAFLASGKVQ